MSLLDRLQELLDGRGVKYERRSFVSYDHESVEYVKWRGVGGLEFNAMRSCSNPDMLYIDNTVISPEDAVDATIGRETCHMVLKDDHEVYGEALYIWWECDECGVTIPKTVGMPELRYCPSCGRRIVK